MITKILHWHEEAQARDGFEPRGLPIVGAPQRFVEEERYSVYTSYGNDKTTLMLPYDVWQELGGPVEIHVQVMPA